MKKLKALFVGLGLFAGSFLGVQAITCTNVFPASLNGYISGACIPSAWGNALEAKDGITGSTATSSLDYQINHIFTSYGSESITSSAIPWANYSTVSLPSSTWLVSSTNFVGTFNGATGTRTYGVTSANPFISVTTSTANATLTFSSSSLNLGTISSFGAGDYLTSSTVYVSTIDGSTGGAYSIKAGTNVAVTTSSNSITISVNNTSTAAAGSTNDVQFNNNGVLSNDTGNFDYSTSSKQLTLSAPTSSEIIGSSTYFATTTIYIPFSVTSTASTTNSFVVPGGVSIMQVTINGAGGNGANFGASGGGNHGWISTTSTTPVATSTMLALCGGGSGNSSGGNGTAGQGVNGYPDTYGGIAESGGTPNTGSSGTCFVNGSATNVTTSTANNGGSNTQNGYGGGQVVFNFAVTPGTTYYYYLGTSPVTGSGTGGGTSTIAVSFQSNPTALTQQNFSLAISNTIITGGSPPTASAATGGATVIGNNTASVITNGSSTATVTETFSTSTPYSNPAYFNAPICTASVASGTAYAIKVAATTSTVVLTPTSNFATSSNINIICLGH